MNVTNKEKFNDHSGITAEELIASVNLATSSIMFQTFLKHKPNEGINYCWGAGNPDTARILFIGEAPGAIENDTGIVFSGPAGKCISGVLHASGISRKRDCYFVNTTMFTPLDYTNYSGIGKPSVKTLVGERNRIIDIINVLRPNLKAVVCLGTYAVAQMLFNDDLSKAVKNDVDFSINTISPTKMRGWYSNETDYNIPTYITYHPSYILRVAQKDNQATQIDEYLYDFRQLKKVVK